MVGIIVVVGFWVVVVGIIVVVVFWVVVVGIIVVVGFWVVVVAIIVVVGFCKIADADFNFIVCFGSNKAILIAANIFHSIGCILTYCACIVELNIFLTLVLLSVLPLNIYASLILSLLLSLLFLFINKKLLFVNEYDILYFLAYWYPLIVSARPCVIIPEIFFGLSKLSVIYGIGFFIS